jgi:hypothetical protein
MMIERYITEDKIECAKELWLRYESIAAGTPAHYTLCPESKTRWAGILAQRELPLWIREVSDIDAELIDADPTENADVEIEGYQVEVKNCSVRQYPSKQYQVIVDRRIFRNYDRYFFTFYRHKKRTLYLAGGIDRHEFESNPFMRVFTEGMEHLPDRFVRPGDEKLQLPRGQLHDPVLWLSQFGHVDPTLRDAQIAFEYNL